LHENEHITSAPCIQGYCRLYIVYFFYPGAFICIYVGNLFESEEANKQGQNFGDEYFADLDMIEVVERQKVKNSAIWDYYEFCILHGTVPGIVFDLLVKPDPTRKQGKINNLTDLRCRCKIGLRNDF
jgi:hypothetical protein